MLFRSPAIRHPFSRLVSAELDAKESLSGGVEEEGERREVQEEGRAGGSLWRGQRIRRRRGGAHEFVPGYFEGRVGGAEGSEVVENGEERAA